jgi:integration host factor subunit beta
VEAGKFTKAEIIDAIYQKSDMHRADIKLVLDTIFDSIKEALISGRTVELRGFGTFGVRVRKGRSKGRNPRTGEIIPVSPHATVFFRAGREIKREIGQNSEFYENKLDEQLPDEEDQ